MNGKLEILYELIPVIDCPSGCTKCCGPVEVSKDEAENMGIAGHKCTRWDSGYNCEFLTEHGCSIYDKRPLTCRLFGTGKDNTGTYCHHRREAGFKEGPLSQELQNELMECYFMLLYEDGRDPICNDDVLFAISEHDLRKGFNPFGNAWDTLVKLDPDIERRYREWRKKEGLIEDYRSCTGLEKEDKCRSTKEYQS